MDVPLTKMEQILANRYAPLVFPNPLSTMPTGDYHKYMPTFTGAGDYTAEEHIEAFMLMLKLLTFQKKMCGPEFLCRVWMAKPRSGSKSYRQIQ
jgi:hypothetical protein